MKREDSFGLVLRVGSVQRLDLPEPAQAEKHVAPEPQTGPAPSRSPPGRRRCRRPRSSRRPKFQQSFVSKRVVANPGRLIGSQDERVETYGRVWIRPG
jgi:hypothetical protein